MRRIISLVAVIVLSLSTAVGISAQDATPPGGAMGPPDSFEIAPGVVATDMVFAEGEAPVSYRLSFEAGVVYTVEPSGNLELGYLEFGSLVFTFDAAVVTGQVGDLEAGGDVVPAGTEVTLEAGQFLVLQPGVSGEARNDGNEPAVLSVAGLTPGGGAAPMATPEATPEY